jgi:hypothetical protein
MSTHTKTDRKKAILDMMDDYDLSDSTAWNKLDMLSTHTHVDTIEVDPEGIIIEDNKTFRGVANVYVSLEYGSKRDSFTTSDSFLGHFKGHFGPKNAPIIDEFDVDTSSFYE